MQRSGIRVVVGIVALAALVFAGWWFLIRDVRPRVLLVGDSLMGQTAPVVEGFLGGDVNVRTEAVNGTGLLSREQYDWLSKLPGIVDDFDPDVVVVSFNGNCAPPVGIDPDQPIECDTPEFFTQWREAAERATDELQAGGAKVFWVLPPPEAVPIAQRRARGLGDVYRDLAAEHPEVGIVDGYKALADEEGNYVGTAEGPSGPEVLRAPDTVHFTEAGARRFALPIIAAVLPFTED